MIIYRAKKFGDRVLLTTEHGDCCVVTEEEFKHIQKEELDNALKTKLETKGIIVNEKNIDRIIKKLRDKKQFLFTGPSLHIIVVTLRCNMNCIYCHASSSPESSLEYDMTLDTAKRTVDFIFQTQSPTFTIEFQGGEPLLNWDIVKYIVKYVQEKNKIAKKDVRLTMVTNLIGMDESKMNFLVENDVSICTSLDGPKHLHDSNRKYRESNYEYVIRWINRFSEEYKNRKLDRRVNALVTLTKKSLQYPKEIVDEYVKLGLKIIHLRFLNNLGVARNAWDSITYSVDEHLLFWKKAVEYIEELRAKGIDIEERMVKIMLDKMHGTEPNYLELRSPCGAAIGQLAYNYNGDIYTCDEARMLLDDDIFKLGSVSDKMKELITGNKSCNIINASINDQFVCDDCVYKPFCGICPVCNYVEQGSIIGKITQTQRCKIYKAQFDWVVERFIN